MVSTKVKTDPDEWEQAFAQLHNEEITRQAALNETIFKMGDLLNLWQPDEMTLRKLAHAYGYRVSTLVTRMYAAREIPAEARNPRLSFTAHVAALAVQIPEDDEVKAQEAQQARRELIESGDGLTASGMKLKVDEKRIELGQKRPGRARGRYVSDNDDAQERMQKLQPRGGFDISDGINIVKVRASILDGEVQLEVTATEDFEVQPAVTIVNGQPRKFLVNCAVMEG